MHRMHFSSIEFSACMRPFLRHSIFISFHFAQTKCDYVSSPLATSAISVDFFPTLCCVSWFDRRKRTSSRPHNMPFRFMSSDALLLFDVGRRAANVKEKNRRNVLRFKRTISQLNNHRQAKIHQSLRSISYFAVEIF